MFCCTKHSLGEAGLEQPWLLQQCARVAEMRSTMLEMTPMWLLLQSGARKLLVSSVSWSSLLCPVLPALCPCWRSCPREGHGLHCRAPVGTWPSCHPYTLQGAGEAALQAAEVFPDMKEAIPWSSELLTPQSGASPAGESTGSPKGTSSRWGSLAAASTDTLPLYSKYIYNFGITRGLDAWPCASSSLLKSLLYLYAKITNTSSVMAIFTHILYFTAVQKNCAIWVNTLCFLKSLL